MIFLSRYRGESDYAMNDLLYQCSSGTVQGPLSRRHLLVHIFAGTERRSFARGNESNELTAPKSRIATGHEEDDCLKSRHSTHSRLRPGDPRH